MTEARKRGAHFPDDWDDLDGRRLLRLALSRADAAQVRTTPQHLDEAFICANCKRDVPEGAADRATTAHGACIPATRTSFRATAQLDAAECSPPWGSLLRPRV